MRQDWGFSVAPTRQADFEAAANAAAARVSVSAEALHQVDTALAAAASLASEMQGGPDHLITAMFTGHANEYHPGDGDVHDGVSITVACSCHVPVAATTTPTAEPSAAV